MRSSSRKKLPTDTPQTPLTSLGTAFAGLESLDNLPTGGDDPADESRSAPGKGRVVLRREKAGRGGKTVIVVDDFALDLPDSVIDSMARKLRAACGCGGTVKGRTLEIQGDQAGRIREILEAEGFKVAGVK